LELKRATLEFLFKNDAAIAEIEAGWREEPTRSKKLRELLRQRQELKTELAAFLEAAGILTKGGAGRSAEHADRFAELQCKLVKLDHAQDAQRKGGKAHGGISST
jgi:hypothetical protein